MLSSEPSFANNRLEAAKLFAHTMIVVDDEADMNPVVDEDVPSKVNEPDRGTPTTEMKASGSAASGGKVHPLNSKIVVDQALELGIICSIVQPGKREKFVNKVSNAAKRADIVSLDWQMYKDDGDTARSIIKGIIRTDSRNGGRLRLIAIYTGDAYKENIYKSIVESIPTSTSERYNIRIKDGSIISDHGLRIVWLLKGSGIARKDAEADSQVKEEELANRLQIEFSKLSQGLLSNVALATIASVRDATHHVLGKFNGQMDGPYFHHRALLQNAEDAEGYAVSIVLSELKSAVNKQKIAKEMAGSSAIKNRIRELSNGGGDFDLHYLAGKKEETKTKISLKQVCSITVDGWNNTDEQNRPKGVSKSNAKSCLSSLYTGSYQAGRDNMKPFASLTGIRSHPGSQLHGYAPQLVLGSVIRTPCGTYLICLQASCDTVRVDCTDGFYFVPMIEKDDEPDHVVPFSKIGGIVEYLGLKIENKAYTKSRSISFLPSNGSIDETIRASKFQGRKGYYFTGVDKLKYRWIANLKQQRAMRSAQWVRQCMGRIGFDEFEPFRPN